MKETTLLEIVFPAAELLKVGLERDEIEDRLVVSEGRATIPFDERSGRTFAGSS